MLELDTKKIFSNEREILVTNTMRGLRSNNKKKVTKHIEDLYEKMLEQGTFVKWEEIHNNKATKQEVIDTY